MDIVGYCLSFGIGGIAAGATSLWCLRKKQRNFTSKLKQSFAPMLFFGSLSIVAYVAIMSK